MPPVICTCSYCRKCRVIIYGIEQPGKQVSASTRLDHQKRDKRGPLTHDKNASLPNSVPKDSNAQNLPKGVK